MLEADIDITPALSKTRDGKYDLQFESRGEYSILGSSLSPRERYQMPTQCGKTDTWIVHLDDSVAGCVLFATKGQSIAEGEKSQLRVAFFEKHSGYLKQVAFPEKKPQEDRWFYVQHVDLTLSMRVGRRWYMTPDNAETSKLFQTRTQYRVDTNTFLSYVYARVSQDALKSSARRIHDRHSKTDWLRRREAELKRERMSRETLELLLRRLSGFGLAMFFLPKEFKDEIVEALALNPDKNILKTKDLQDVTKSKEEQKTHQKGFRPLKKSKPVTKDTDQDEDIPLDLDGDDSVVDLSEVRVRKQDEHSSESENDTSKPQS